MTDKGELAGKWERADRQLTLLAGAAAADLLHQPPHMVALGLAKLLSERYEPDVITGYAAMAITRLGMARKAELLAAERVDPGGDVVEPERTDDHDGEQRPGDREG